ncbi:SubName: Full=Uncharacterized protein {ECO:0000313/EMBL:CCA77121.1} [Serendipita indica DSM 11827]|nr:SubName: Full=Uncharacterized protein {ECO:0000313/EMBL:CCA77121.1} [Serendipita indica DSM 11827]
MSYPPAAPQTYDHPFAYQLPTLTPAPVDAAPTQQLLAPPARNPEHRYAVPAPPHLQATPIHLGLRVIRIINLLDHIRLGIHMNAIPPGQPNGPPNTPRSPYNPRAHMPCPPTEERDFVIQPPRQKTKHHLSQPLADISNRNLSRSPIQTARLRLRISVLPLEPILQTSPARVQRARRRQTGQLASAHVPSSSAPLAKLDMNITGGSTTSQTSATCATGGAVSSKLGPLTPSTHHSRDPHDERVLELLSRVATGMTTPVATAPEQSMAGAGDGGTAGNLTDSND